MLGKVAYQKIAMKNLTSSSFFYAAARNQTDRPSQLQANCIFNTFMADDGTCLIRTGCNLLLRIIVPAELAKR